MSTEIPQEWVEKGAEVLHASLGYPTQLEWEEIPGDDLREYWRDAARAVLAATVDDVRRAVAEEWIVRLSALCDDDWLRRRDRCMELPGSSSRHERTAASAWEHAAHTIRSLLNEHGYEDEYVNTHASYMAWMRNGRDEGQTALASPTDRDG